MWVLRDLVKTSAFPRCAQVLAESESVIDLIIILFGREEILKVIFFFSFLFPMQSITERTMYIHMVPFT